jgi:hypothetical protein
MSIHNDDGVIEKSSTLPQKSAFYFGEFCFGITIIFIFKFLFQSKPESINDYLLIFLSSAISVVLFHFVKRVFKS